jgi:hypothetical protein
VPTGLLTEWLNSADVFGADATSIRAEALLSVPALRLDWCSVPMPNGDRLVVEVVGPR